MSHSFSHVFYGTWIISIKHKHYIRFINGLQGRPYISHPPLALNWNALAQVRPGLCFLLHVESSFHFWHPNSIQLWFTVCPVWLSGVSSSFALPVSLTHSLKSLPSSLKYSANSCLPCLWSQALAVTALHYKQPRMELWEAGLWISIPVAVPRTHASPHVTSVPWATPYQMPPSSYSTPHPLGITTMKVHCN